MLLFEGKETTKVVTAKDIKELTGIKPSDYHFENVEDEEQALNSMLETWIKRIASHVYARLERSLSEKDAEYEAIQDIIVRTVAKLVAISLQQRTSPVVRINDFAINILNTSEVTKDLNDELEPFLRKNKGWVEIFSSLDDFEG